MTTLILPHLRPFGNTWKRPCRQCR